MSRKDELYSLTTEDRRQLEEGLKLFRANYAADGGRSGMLIALQEVLRYFMRVLPAGDVQLMKPLLHLERALYDLDRTGNKAKCLEGRNRGNADSDPVVEVKACALAISDILKLFGKCSRKDADRQAAAIVSNAAVAIGVKLPKPRKRVDGKLIESWRRGARPRGRGSDAAASILADRKATVQEEIARAVLTLQQENGQVDLDNIIRNVIHPDPREWPDRPEASVL